MLQKREVIPGRSLRGVTMYCTRRVSPSGSSTSISSPPTGTCRQVNRLNFHALRLYGVVKSSIQTRKTTICSFIQGTRFEDFRDKRVSSKSFAHILGMRPILIDGNVFNYRPTNHIHK